MDRRSTRRGQRSEQLAFTLEGPAPIAYRLRRSRRRRRTMEISIDEAGVVSVAAPATTPQREIETFLQHKARWIEQRLTEHQHGARALPGGESLPYLGQQLLLRVVDGEHAHASARLTGGVLEVRVPDGGLRERVREPVERWYREQARVTFSERLQLFARRVGVRPVRLIVSAQKTCWGSCGRDGTLRLNWHLMMAPLPLVDYIVVHELCHLRRSGHGAAFWRLVAAVLPDYQARRAALRRNAGSYRLP